SFDSDAHNPDIVASESWDRRVQDKSRSCVSEDENRRLTVSGSSGMRVLKNLVSARPWPSVASSRGPPGLGDPTAEDEAATGTAVAIWRLNRWVRGAGWEGSRPTMK